MQTPYIEYRLVSHVDAGEMEALVNGLAKEGFGIGGPFTFVSTIGRMVQPMIRISKPGPAMVDPAFAKFDHDGDGKPGGSLKRKQGVVTGSEPAAGDPNVYPMPTAEEIAIAQAKDAELQRLEDEARRQQKESEDAAALAAKEKTEADNAQAALDAARSGGAHPPEAEPTT